MIDEQERLRRYCGSHELDDEGRRLDRREFPETIRALHWLATCQMGWHRNRDRYRRDLLRVLGDDFTRHGLPTESGITLRVAPDGQSWYAWRRTVTLQVGVLPSEPPDRRPISGRMMAPSRQRVFPARTLVGATDRSRTRSVAIGRDGAGPEQGTSDPGRTSQG